MSSERSQPAKKPAVDVETTLRSAFSKARVPLELQDAVLTAFAEIVTNYRGSQLRPSEFNGGDFTEAMVRVLQFLATGKYSQLGKSLPRMEVFLADMQKSPLDDSMRIHVPRHLQAIYDVRNRRGVGHLPGPVSANKPDAELILITARWILAEFVRIYVGVARPEEAQKAVDLISEIEQPLVENFDGVLRVVARRRYSNPEKVLILLWSSKEDVPVQQLVKWLRIKRSTALIAINRLVQKDLLHKFDDGRLRLTSLGKARAHELCV